MREQTDAQKVGAFTAEWIVSPDREIKTNVDQNGALSSLVLSISAPGAPARSMTVQAATGPLSVVIAQVQTR